MSWDARATGFFLEIGDGFGQRHLRRVPITPAEEGIVLALLERHEVVREPELLGAEVPVEVLAHDGLEFEDQRISDRFLCHAVTVTRIHRFRKICRAQ